ncbi:MAG: chromate transporter, partial [Bacteroidota bacterium]|nr:chromate transporter [Bacteroidota bacterium]
MASHFPGSQERRLTVTPEQKSRIEVTHGMTEIQQTNHVFYPFPGGALHRVVDIRIEPDLASMPAPSRVGELVRLFAKRGFIAFGGPAAHIAMLEDEVVTRREWVSRQHFLDLVGATNLIPGPNSTEMMMHIGYERAGWKGLLAAGAAFS